MKVEPAFLIIFALAFVFDLIMGGIDFKSFILGVGLTFLAYNWKEIFNFKRKLP